MNYRQLSRNLKDDKSSVLFFQQYKILPDVVVCNNGHQMTLSFVIKYVGDATKLVVLKNVFIIPHGLRVRNLPLKLAHFIYGWAFHLIKSMILLIL